MNYEKQANDFLKKTSTTIEVKFLENNYHFEGDTETRDIYEVQIKRGTRIISFKFGQSIVNSQRWGYKQPKYEDCYIDPRKAPKSAKILIKGKPPTNYDILTRLTKYDVGTFEEFCREFDYDTDSKKAEKIYNACVQEYSDVQKIWSDEEIELLQEIQ